MVNPPPVGPWFHLVSVRSIPTPAPTPPQEPHTTLGMPAFRTALAPSSPQIHVRLPMPSPTNSPKKIKQFDHSLMHLPSPLPSPTHSPKTIKQFDRSPIHSPLPNNEPITPPPSSLTLPPAQLKSKPRIPEKAEPKTLLVRKTIDKPKPLNNGNAHNEKHNHVIGKESESKEKGMHKKVLDSEDSSMRVITIVGENKGAYMELTQTSKKREAKYLHKKGNLNIDVDRVELEIEDGSVSKKDKNKKGRTTSSFPMVAYMNSNVQCVNSSLLYHTFCPHHEPGVCLSLSKKPFVQGFHVKEHTNAYHT